jgi:hypothetical protein
MTDSDFTFETHSFSGKSYDCYGIALACEALRRAGGTAAPFDLKTRNPIMVSLYWPEQVFDFIRWKYRSSAMRGRKIIVGGNYPTTSPQACAPFCDAVFMGDGELWDGKMDGPYIARKGEPRERAVATEINPIPFEDLQDTRRSFVEISRGCRNKCLFCQYGWLKRYREADIAEIEQVIRLSNTKSIRVFAADRFQHRSYDKINALLEKRGKNDTGSDVSIRFLLKHPEYLKYTRKIRVGIEGMSYRLRRMVGKNYTDEDILRFCLMVADAGIKTLDWYMIYGLPTERFNDIEQFSALIRKLDDAMPEKYTIAIHWNAFTPSAQTPLQWCAPAHGKNPLLEKFMANTGNRRIKVFHKPRTTGSWTIIKRMLAIRADHTCEKLLFSLAHRETEFKRRPDAVLKFYREATGRNLLSEWPIDVPLPWDEFCKYKKGVMLKAMQHALSRAEADLNHEN